MPPWNPEIIRAVTPIIIAVSGALIGFVVVVNETVTGEKATAAFGLSGTALAGAAGLAQSVRGESTSSRRENQASESSNS
ncbi:MAG: hypothetical protein HC769_04805 [Cyanobacteria bacterium CRU_2_1]|nr:hypothetical protein [Cyanobacteria bacterium RU_5_0]NJR58228.1 hypothetical protein [Cyanobacteria bacterium CRU_2_1]